MCVCIYTYVYRNTYIHINKYAYTNAPTHTRTRIRTQTYENIRVYGHIHSHILCVALNTLLMQSSDLKTICNLTPFHCHHPSRILRHQQHNQQCNCRPPCPPIYKKICICVEVYARVHADPSKHTARKLHALDDQVHTRIQLCKHVYTCICIQSACR